MCSGDPCGLPCISLRRRHRIRFIQKTAGKIIATIEPEISSCKSMPFLVPTLRCLLPDFLPPPAPPENARVAVSSKNAEQCPRSHSRSITHALHAPKPLPEYLATMANLDNEHNKFGLPQFTKDSIIARTIPPEGTRRQSTKGLTDLPGIIKPGNAYSQIIPDTPGTPRIKFSDLPCSCRRDFNLPGCQVQYPARPAKEHVPQTCDALSGPARRNTDLPSLPGIH